MKPKLLVVAKRDDLIEIKQALASDYDLIVAENRIAVRKALTLTVPPVVLLNLERPSRSQRHSEGLSILAELAAVPIFRIIAVTDDPRREVEMMAIRNGAHDVLLKPLEMASFRVILRRAFFVADLQRTWKCRQNLKSGTTFEGMLGSSPPIRAVFAAIQKIAATDAPTLILGETGTGKELAALAIHRLSRRKYGPFITINCGTIPDNLVESELFGFEKGSFSGAEEKQAGRLEAAQQGTLFLDEVAELPLSSQVKLLRFLQGKTIERIGSSDSIFIDARVIAATTRDVTDPAKRGGFRSDLFFRLAVVSLRIPPLRERCNDIRLLAEAFLRSAAGNRTRFRFTRSALVAMENYPWPGNVRELQSRTKRATMMARGARISPRDLDLPEVQGTSPDHHRDLKQARAELEKQMIRSALRQTSGNVTAAASILGITRQALYELINKLDPSKKD